MQKRGALCAPRFCGQRWIRTTEVERQQIYSLPHLATLEFAQMVFLLKDDAKVQLFFESTRKKCRNLQNASFSH